MAIAATIERISGEATAPIDTSAQARPTAIDYDFYRKEARRLHDEAVRNALIAFISRLRRIFA